MFSLSRRNSRLLPGAWRRQTSPPIPCGECTGECWSEGGCRQHNSVVLGLQQPLITALRPDPGHLAPACVLVRFAQQRGIRITWTGFLLFFFFFTVQLSGPTSGLLTLCWGGSWHYNRPFQGALETRSATQSPQPPPISWRSPEKGLCFRTNRIGRSTRTLCVCVCVCVCARVRA